MALSKSGKTGSNVTHLDAVRKKRSTKSSPEKKSSSAPARKPASKATNKAARKIVAKVAPPPKTEEDTVEATAASPVKDKTATTEKIDKEKKKASRPRVSNRRFDTEKVERIKAAIARGDYQINYLQVADKFIEHERYA